jgi:hypothetical protein
MTVLSNNGHGASNGLRKERDSDCCYCYCYCLKCYVLADNFDSSVLSYSLPNHWYAVAGQAPAISVLYGLNTGPRASIVHSKVINSSNTIPIYPPQIGSRPHLKNGLAHLGKGLLTTNPAGTTSRAFIACLLLGIYQCLYKPVY